MTQRVNWERHRRISLPVLAQCIAQLVIPRPRGACRSELYHLYWRNPRAPAANIDAVSKCPWLVQGSVTYVTTKQSFRHARDALGLSVVARNNRMLASYIT